MKRLYSMILMLVMLLLPIQMRAEGSAIKVEFGDTSMTIELSQQPKIVNEEGTLVLKTSAMSVVLTLPCKITPIGGSDTAIEDVVIRNNSDNAPISVFTIEGKKMATLKDKSDAFSLGKGIYIINGKKVVVK
jgi:hypothetical protein